MSNQMSFNPFVDPAIMEDPNLDDVKTITLSYTFFASLRQDESNSAALDRAAALN